MRLIGVDVGGTFTDLVHADTEAGRATVHKASTTRTIPRASALRTFLGGEEGMLAWLDQGDGGRGCNLRFRSPAKGKTRFVGYANHILRLSYIRGPA
jgi:hypothetical protein